MALKQEVTFEPLRMNILCELLSRLTELQIFLLYQQQNLSVSVSSSTILEAIE